VRVTVAGVEVEGRIEAIVARHEFQAQGRVRSDEDICVFDTRA
jgi:hypothetical protein